MKVIINDQLVEYKDEGSGRVILLLHGWGTNLTTYDNLTEYLSKKFRVVRFDFPGFGNSPIPAGNWSVDDYARLTGGLIKKLQIENLYCVIGHSFGGRVIIKGISQKYFNPHKVVLMGAAGVKPNINFKKTVYKVVAKIGKVTTSLPGIKKLQPLLRRKLYASAGSTDYLNAKQMQKTFQKVVNEDLLPLVADIKQPALLIWGENDSETPVSDAQLMFKNVGNGKLEVIPEAGHFVYQDNFEKVSSELGKFLL